jgi:hypothetical protein
MAEWLSALALFLLLNVVAGLVRIARGPTPADRIVAAQLFGTTGVAILLLLAQALEPRRPIASGVRGLCSGVYPISVAEAYAGS